MLRGVRRRLQTHLNPSWRLAQFHTMEPNAGRDHDADRERLSSAMDESRRLMLQREKAMTVEERVKLFEDLSRNAAWIRRSARRIR
jgi:hypothetical protein